MAISLQKSNQLKSIAILMMLCLHLFNRDYKGLFEPLLFIGKQPLSYYISLFSDACVPIFAFVSGYGLYFKFRQDQTVYKKGNLTRLKKLYLNYWIILFLFAVLLGWLLSVDGYPGSWLKFIGNLSGLDPSYNDAWWFFTTYVVFTLSSKFWFSLIEKINLIVFIVLLLVVYVISFYLRIYKPGIFGSGILEYFYRQFYLYFCTLFQFMLGAFALRFEWDQKVQTLFSKFKFKTLTAVLGIVFLIVFHGVFPNFIVAPFTGLAFIFLFLQIKFSKSGNRILDFFKPHSTNLWLIHMFFYMIFFPDFIYGFKYPLLIFSVLIVMCLISSYVVNFLNQKLQKILL